MASVNFYSINSCKQAYIDYVLRGNSCGYEASDIGKITAMYADMLEYWKENPDTTEFEITDSEYNAAFLNGEEDAKNQTNYDGDRGESNWHTGADGVKGLAAGAGGTVSGILFAKEGGLKGIKDALFNYGSIEKEASFLSGDGVLGKLLENSWMITCALTAASAAGYYIQKPNEAESKACQEMISVQEESVAELNQKSVEMEEANQESLELSDEADYITEESNEELESQKTEYDMARDTIEALKTKLERGEQLSEEEKNLWKECAALMQENSDGITVVQNDTNSKVTDINSKIAEKQENFDNVAVGMAELQGKTDFAASFDKATKAATIAEGVNKTVTSAGGFMAAAKGVASALHSTVGVMIAKLAIAAGGAAAAVICGNQAKEQFEMSNIVQGEIDIRKKTETFNTQTNELYETNLEAYVSNKETIEDLELDIPEDIEAPEEMEAPQNTSDSSNNNSSASAFGFVTENQDDNNSVRRR